MKKSKDLEKGNAKVGEKNFQGGGKVAKGWGEMINYYQGSRSSETKEEKLYGTPKRRNWEEHFRK